MEIKKVIRSRKTYRDKKNTYDKWLCFQPCGTKDNKDPAGIGTGILFYLIPSFMIGFLLFLALFKG